MACNLPACTEKSTHPSSNTQPIVIGAIVGLGLLYYYFMPHSKRKWTLTMNHEPAVIN